MIITISGLSGSGKTSVATKLGQLLKIEAVDVGAIFRRQAKKLGLNVIELGQLAGQNPKIDQRIDQQTLAAARKLKKVILQGRLSGWLMVKYHLPALKIWLAATLKTRIKRIAQREAKTIQLTQHETKIRDIDTKHRYLKTYGIDINDLSIYDVVIKTDQLNLDQIVKLLLKQIQKYGSSNPAQPAHRPRHGGQSSSKN